MAEGVAPRVHFKWGRPPVLGTSSPATLQVATPLHFEPNNRRVAKLPGQRSPSVCCGSVCVQLTKGVVGHRAQRASSGRW